MVLINDNLILNKIYFIRGEKVMLDADLAELYAVKTKNLNKSVKRNIHRFPEDFMFQLSESEMVGLRFQIGTSKRGGVRYLPFAFTEQGVAMLSCVLNSPVAIEVNIKIIRIFIRMRKLLESNVEILRKLNQMEEDLKNQGKYLTKHEKEIQLIFQALRKLIAPENQNSKKIGYKRKNEG